MEMNLQGCPFLAEIRSRYKKNSMSGASPVRLGNRTYRAWRTTKLTPMVRFLTAPGIHQERHSYPNEITELFLESSSNRAYDTLIIVDSENKFTFFEIYVRVYDYGIFNRFTQTRA